MSLIRYNPTNVMRRNLPLPGNLEAMDRWFDGMFQSFFGDSTPRGSETNLSAFYPAVDIQEEQDALVVRAEIPGVKKDDIEIAVHGDTLTIKGSKSIESSRENNQFSYSERSYGEFRRSFTLPRTVDPEKVQAQIKDGVLEVRMPIAESAKPRRIEINTV